MDPPKPLLFISSSPSPKQDRAIRSHVHGTHRQWSKLRRLRRSPQSATPLFPQTSPEAPTTHEADEEDQNDQKRPPMTVTRRTNRDSSGNPATTPLSLFGGNRDPFNSAAIRITPYVFERIRLAGQFKVFRTWPALRSDEVCRRLAARHQEHLRLAIGDAANIHVLLATGSCVKSDYVAALWHKTKAISLFRHQLPGPISTYYTIRLLMSLEAFAKDFATARIHHRAAVKFIACYHNLEQTAVDPLPISDVWLAAHSFQRTEMEIDDWDPGLRSLSALPPYPMIPYPELRCWMRGAHEIAVALAQDVLTYEEVMWTTTRAAALSGRLNNRLHDHYEFQHYKTCDRLQIAINVSLSCAMHVLFTTNTYTSGQRALYTPFRNLLKRVNSSLDQSLSLWLHFMCAVNDQLLNSRSNWAWQQFKAVQREANLSWAGVQQILRHFVYTEEMESVLYGRTTLP